MDNQLSKYFIAEVPVTLTYPLRHKVLRPHQTIEQVKYVEDDLFDAVHFAIFDATTHPEQTIVGILSLYHEALNIPANDLLEPLDLSTIHWRLRGMAVEPDYQRQKLGSMLLNECYKYVLKQEQTAAIWCNARTQVIPYYQHHGFQIVTETFELPNIGPHVVMVNLSPTVT